MRWWMLGMKGKISPSEKKHACDKWRERERENLSSTNLGCPNYNSILLFNSYAATNQKLF